MSNESVLDKHYDPAEVEGAIYATWAAAGAFRAPITDPPAPREHTFTILIPPTNVPRPLHFAHTRTTPATQHTPAPTPTHPAPHTPPPPPTTPPTATAPLRNRRSVAKAQRATRACLMFIGSR